MNRRLSLDKEKLPKRKRRTDDDDVYIKGMYNPFLDTKGYDVEEITTAEKGVLADFPELEGLGWMFDSEVKDYETLLKNRRNKMTQTFRYMLKQNILTSEKSLSSEEKQAKQDSSSLSEDRETSEASEEKERQKSLMQRLFGSLFEEVEVDLPSSRQTSQNSGGRGSNDARQSLASIRDPMPNKKSETPIQSSSSSSSATSRSVLLPVESAPVSVNSSRSQTIEYVDEEDLPVNVSSSSSNRTVRYISSGSSRRSRPITISSGSR